MRARVHRTSRAERGAHTTYGSLLAAAGVDLVAIQAAMGHSALVTTSRYLHARPASEQAAVFTRAFAPTVSETLHA